MKKLLLALISFISVSICTSLSLSAATPLDNCNMNDVCETAIVIPNVNSDFRFSYIDLNQILSTIPFWMFCVTSVFNQVPPPNDEPCNAIQLQTNNTCMDGTTVDADPETLGWPPGCQGQDDNVVWYKIQLADTNNVGFLINLVLEENHPTMEVGVFLYPGTDCNNIPNPSFIYCGDPPTEPLQFGPLANIPYLLAIGTSESNETDFEICVDEIPPCFTNDDCSVATGITNVESNAPFVCVAGCNLFADPEDFQNSCSIEDFSTVWYQVQTDNEATLMNIVVNSEDFETPTITLFLQPTDCSDIIPVSITGSNLPCVVGSGGKAQAIGTDVGANSIYYIAVSSLNDVGGDFELCVNTLSAASLCVVDGDIEITARSSGGDLAGPFFPGETVSVCLNVNSYTAANNGCQWFQGIIPVFGNGWDPSSFDGVGQPINATINNNVIGEAGNGLYGAATWDWFSNVDYHYRDTFLQVGDFDSNGKLDICNRLHEPDCPNAGGIQPGCCGPCWMDSIGTILPPGWFAYGVNGTCITPGPPIGLDWGDGNSCASGMGPWRFCFDLKARDFPDCIQSSNPEELLLKFYTMSDGQTGAWTAPPPFCQRDEPIKLTLQLDCGTALDIGVDSITAFCSGDSLNYAIDHPGVADWTWTISPEGHIAQPIYTGLNGYVLQHQVQNTTDAPVSVLFSFFGDDADSDTTLIKQLRFLIYPDIALSLPPDLLLCERDSALHLITPSLAGGTGSYFYLWRPTGENTSDILVQRPFPGEVILDVFDEAGCTASDTMKIKTRPCLGGNLPEDDNNDDPIPQDSIPKGNIQPDIPQIIASRSMDDERSLSVYPVPSKDVIMIELNRELDPGEQIIITDLNGVRYAVLTNDIFHGKRKSIALDNMTSGIYLVSLYTDRQVITRRMVKI